MSTSNQTKNNVKPPRPLRSGKLTAFDQKFIANYIKSGDAVWALRQAGFPEVSSKIINQRAKAMLSSPKIKEEIDRVMQEAKKEGIMNAEEVMEYFSAVVRGEIKDQFGLDAPLSERTKAAIELARRTIDIENRQKMLEENNPIISIKLIRD